jgi:nucleobase:cation symporter-1, NCS1 family
MVFQNPPQPRAMSDDELNARILELQAQPDGLIAAMALIEEQTKLREEDALALSHWQLQAQMEAAANPQPSSSNFFDDSLIQSGPASAQVNPDPEVVADPEPEIDIFASVAPPQAVTDPVLASADIPTQAPPIENIDDVVAALNASYAQAAVEPEVVIESYYEETVTVISSEPELTQDEILEPEPEPVLAQLLGQQPVAGSVQQTQPEAESFASVDEPAKDQVNAPAATRSSWGFSFATATLASSPLIFLLAGWIRDSGASLAQAVILLGSLLLVSATLFAIGSVAAKRGSSSLSVLSRAAFGVWGNIFPTAIMFLVKLLWLGALVFLATRILAPLLYTQPWFVAINSGLMFPVEFTATALVALALVLFGAVVAGLGGITVLRSQIFTSTISLLTVISVAVFIFMSYSIQSLAMGAGIVATELVDVGLLAFAIFGFAAISQSGDFARKLDPNTPSSKVFFLSFVVAFFIPLLIGVLGLAWLYMDPELGDLFVSDPLGSVAAAAPAWAFVAFCVGLGISLLALVSLSSYSIAGTLQGLGASWRAVWVQLPVALVVIVSVLGVSYLVSVSSLITLLTEALLIAAVPAAAWLGILLSDSLIRVRNYHEVSLTREYGFYGRVNVVNLIGFVFAIGLGFGYLNSTGFLTSWSGYLGGLTPSIYQILGNNVGIAMAFGLALLIPVAFGIPRIRKQEQNLLELDQRREELKEFLDTVN